MAEQTYQSYKDDGFMVIILLLDGYQESVNETVNYYGLTFPVLNDQTYEATIGMGNTNVEVPYHVLLNRDMSILTISGSVPGSSTIEGALEAEWPEVDRPVMTSGEDPAETDLGGDIPSGNPFSAESVVTWDGGAACSASPSGGAGLALLLLLIPALILRRR